MVDLETRNYIEAKNSLKTMRVRTRNQTENKTKTKTKWRLETGKSAKVRKRLVTRLNRIYRLEGQKRSGD